MNFKSPFGGFFLGSKLATLGTQIMRETTVGTQLRSLESEGQTKGQWWATHSPLRTPVLVGGWTNPSEKILVRQKWIIFPGIGVKIKNIWNHHLLVAYYFLRATRGIGNGDIPLDSDFKKAESVTTWDLGMWWTCFFGQDVFGPQNNSHDAFDNWDSWNIRNERCSICI